MFLSLVVAPALDLWTWVPHRWRRSARAVDAAGWQRRPAPVRAAPAVSADEAWRRRTEAMQEEARAALEQPFNPPPPAWKDVRSAHP